MGIFKKKKQEEPEEVESSVQRKKSVKKQAKEEPQMMVQLSGSEMYLANLLQQIGIDLLEVKNKQAELQELIESNL